MDSWVSDRTNLLEQALALLGTARVGLLVADREFVGEWVRHLVERHIGFCLRLSRTHPIPLRNGEVWTVEALLMQRPEQFYE